MNNTNNAIKSLVMLGIVLISTISNADNANSYSRDAIKKPYFRIDAGYSYPNKFSYGSYTNEKLSKAFLGSFGIGYVVNNKFRTDITVTHRNRYKYSGNGISDENNGNIISASTKLVNTSFMLNGYLTTKGLFKNYHERFERFSPYLMAGIGYAINKVNNIDKTGYQFSTIRYTGSNREQKLAWQIGLGTLIHMQKNIAVDIMYKYIDLGVFKSSNLQKVLANNGNITARVDEPADSGTLKAHEFSVGINFKLN